MRYGAIPDNLIERIGLWFGLAPIPVIDCLCSMMKARTLMAGVTLGIFDEMRGGPRSARQIAAALCLDAPSLELLLRSLVVSGYLVQHGEHFGLTPLSARGLLRDSPGSLAAYVDWNYAQWAMLGRMEEVVRTGRGLDFHQMSAEEDWIRYQQAMLQLARPLRAFFAANVPVPAGSTSLIDVGGGHGLLGAAVCQRHPPLRSTVLELPRAVPAAQQLSRREGLASWVSHRPCNILVDCWGQGRDVALLANVLHHFNPEQVRQILRKAFAALRPGGVLAIWDFVRNDTPKASAADALALFFRLTSGADLHRAADLSDWARGCGFELCRSRRCLQFPDAQLLTMRRPPTAGDG
jgi:2-polyprenyl-3-methyl-5-hydroxy-6-metoxy-1,4-benzoquinol methylase